MRTSRGAKSRFGALNFGLASLVLALFFTLFASAGAGAQTVVVSPLNCAVDGSVAASSVSNVCDGSASTKTVFTADAIVLKVTLAQAAIVTSVNLTAGDDDGLYPYRVAAATQILGCASAGQGCVTAGSSAFSYYEISIVGAGLNQPFDSSKYGCEILGQNTRCLQFSEITLNTSVTDRSLTFDSVTTQAYNTTQTVVARTSAGTGAVSYSSADTNLCTVNSSTGLVTATSGTGTCTINATVASDGVYSSASASVNITLAKATQAAFSFTKSSFMMVWDGVAYTKDITFTPSGGSGSGSVSYSVSNNTATNCALIQNGSSWTISADTGGQCRITAVKAGDSNYLSTTFSTSAYTGNSTYSDFLFQNATLANPTGLSATPIANSSSLTFSFTKAANATNTQVALFVDGTTTTTLKTATISGTSYTFTGLTGNTTYYAAAKSLAGTSDAFYFSASGFSSRVSATTNSPTPLVFTAPTSGLSAVKSSAFSLDLSGLVTGGYGTKTFTKTGSLPSGLSLTGSVISGTPTASGNYSITATVTDQDLATATTSSFTISVAPAPPTITAQPAATTTVAEGGSATISVSATGSGLSYQWKKDGTAISGATGASLAIGPASATDGGTYTVDVTSTENSVTSAPTTSSNAIIVVVDAPVISTQPASKKSYLSVSNSFSVAASVAAGGTISYVWEVSTNSGSTWTAISGATSATYAMTPTQLSEDGKQFRVKVTNTRNSVTKTTTSSAATLNVYSSFSWGTLTSSVNMSVGAAYSLDIDNYVTGGIPSLSYQVLASGLPSGVSFDSTTGILSGTPDRGTVSSSYSITLRAVDGLGGVYPTSKAISISVGKGLYNTPTGLAASATTNTLKSITVTWDPLTMPAWITDNGGYRVEMYSTSGGGTLLKQKDVSTNQVTFTASDYSSMLDSTTYYFQVQARSTVTTDFVISTASARVSATTITPSATPTVTTPLASTTYTFTSTSVTLQVVANASDGGTLSYQWFKSGIAVTGATSSSLTVTSRSSTSGTDDYSVKITNTLNGVPSLVVTNSTSVKSVSFTIDSYGVSSLSGWVVNSPITHTKNANIWGSVSGDTLSFQLTSGTLPAGVSFSTTTGTFSGTPTEAVSNRSMTVVTTSNGTGLTTSNTFNINVAKMSQATLTLSLSSTSSQTGPSKTINITVGGGSGTGDYTIGIANSASSTCKINGGTTPVIATAGSNSVTVSSSTTGIQGTCSVTLNRAADSIYNAATQTSASFLFLSATDTPGSFTAAATANTKKSIKLTWTNGGSSASATLSYRAGIYSSAGVFITNVSSITGTLVSGTTYTTTITATQFPAIADGTTYKFDLTSVGNGWAYGESLPTAMVAATTYLTAATPTVVDVSALSSSINAGDTQSLSATASVTDGGTLTYQWQVATSADSYAVWSDVTSGTGATTNNFTTAALTNATVGYKFRLKVTNTFAGPDTTATAIAYSSQFAVTVTKTSQTITFTNPGDKVLGSGTFNVAPTTSAAGLSVVISSGTTSICTVNSLTVTLVTAGTCTLNANQSGNSSYDAATQVSQSFAVTPPAPVIGTQPANFKGYNSTSSASFSVVATVSTGTLSYQWQTSTDSGVTWTNVGTSSTSYSQSVSPAGSFTFDGYRYRVIVTNTVNSVTASTTSNEAVLSIRLVQAIGTTYFPTTRNVYLDQGTISYSAVTGGGSGNPVTFTVTTPSVCSVSGTTLTLLTVGSCVVKANQEGKSGTTPYYPANEATQTVTISAARSAQTITFTQPSTAIFGDSAVTLAPSSDSGLVVSLTSSTTAVCTVSGSTVTILAVGTCSISAAQPGDSTYLAATTVTKSFTVSPKPLTQGSVTASAPAGERMTISATWTTVSNATGYVVKLWTSGTTERQSFTVGANTTSQTFSPTNTTNLVDNAPYTVSVMATGTGNYTNSAVVHSSLTYTRSVAVVNYNPQQGAGYSPSEFSGTLPSQQRYINGAASPLTVSLNSGNYSRIGYDFLGWNTQPDGSGTTYTPGVTTTYGDINLWPMWQRTALTITFDSNYGTSTTTTQTFEYGVLENLDANTFTRTGYSFAGWATTSGGSVVQADRSGIIVISSRTLFAKWQAIDYSVTYAANGSTASVPTETAKNVGNTVTVKSGITRTGYQFLGWSDGSITHSPAATLTMPARNLTLTAMWQIDVYSISYNSNAADSGSASRTSENFTYGSPAISLPTVGSLAKAGYTFGGWSSTQSGTPLAGNYTPTADATLWAVWSPNTYTVTYNSNGATGAPSRTSDIYITGNPAITVPAAGTMAKAGHTFAGWAITANGNAVGNTFTAASDVTLYAVWQTISYSVTYDSAGGASTPTETNKTIGQTFVLANGPTRANYSFAGWNDGSSTFVAGSTYRVSSSNVTLTASWVRIFWVHYNFNGANEAEPADIEKLDQSSHIAALAPTRNGYTFGGWTAQNGDPIAAGSTFTVDSNHYILSATWNPISYSVSYTSAGSNLPTEANKTIGQAFTIGSAPNRAGYIFAGWNDGALTYGPGSTYVVGDQNVNLTAVWNPINYRITYDLNSGTSSVPVQANRTIGQTFELAAAPTRHGYTFVKWSDGTADYLPGSTYTTGSSNITLTAIWTATQRTITYNLNGASGNAPVETAKVIGDSFSLAAAPAYSGQVFVGWNDGTLTYAAGATYTVGGSSVNLTAQWVAALLTPSFASGGAQGSAPGVSAVAVGMPFTLPSAGTLAKSGFTFSGWSDGVAVSQAGSSYVMPAEGISFTAVWTPIPSSGNSGSSNSGFPPAAQRIIKFGDPAVLLEAQNTLGSPINWKSNTATCSVNQKGQVVARSAGRCEVVAIRSDDFSIASSHTLLIEPRLNIELKNAAGVTSKSAVINASVLWPGANFKAKFCVTKSAQATDCLITSTVTIENEDSIGNSTEAPFVISRKVLGLEPATTYFVHAAVLVGETSYKTVAQMLRTPSISTPKSRALTKSTAWVSWSDMAAGSTVKVVLNGKTICRNSAKNCKIKGLIGPKSKLQIIATNKEGVEALPVVPTFQSIVKPIVLASVQKPASGLTKKQALLIAANKSKALKAGLKAKVVTSRSGLVKVIAYQ